jgi:hypothetical protein
MAAIESSRVVPQPPERVLDFISNLHNHWQLEDAFIELNGVHGDGGHLRIRGPLGISREARTEVVSTGAPAHLRGRAEIGRRTVGSVAWDVEPAGSGSLVTLSARVERASLLDSALLALGGRRWLRRRFEHVLETLGHRLAG